MLFRSYVRVLVAAGALLGPSVARAQTVAEGVLFSSADGYVQANATATDAAGNRYYAGGFAGTMTGPGGVSVTATADADGFVAKLAPSGALLWLRTMAGATTLPLGFSADGATSLALDDAGGVFVGGGFTDSLYVRDGSGVVATLAEPVGSRASLGAFVVRYDASGAVVWARGGGGSPRPDGTSLNKGGADGVLSLARDGAGGIVVGGLMSGTGSFLGAPHPVLPDTVPALAFARLSGAGTVQWLRTGTSTRQSTARSVAVGGTRAYVLGDFVGALDLGGTFSFPDEPGSDAYVAAVDLATGAIAWAGVFSGESEVNANGIAADDEGAVYLTGAIQDVTTEDAPRYASGYVVKYDAAGNYVWIQAFGGIDENAPAYAEGFDVSIGPGGEVVVSGSFQNEVYFFLDPAGASLASEPDRISAFAALFSPGGTFLRAYPLGFEEGYAGNDFTSVATGGTLQSQLFPVRVALEQAGSRTRFREVTTFYEGTAPALTGVASTEQALPPFAAYSGVTAGTSYALPDGFSAGPGQGTSSVTFDDVGEAQTLAFTVEPGSLPPNLPDGAQPVARAWHLAAEAPDTYLVMGFSATVRLCYLESELGGLDEANLSLWRYNGFAGEWEPIPSTPDPATNCVTATGVDMFSPWAIAPAGALPVELTAFAAVRDGETVRLAWTTASETNNAGFGVELRDVSGAAWREVAFVAGRGTSAEAHTYAHTLPGLDPARPYRFRLRQVDTDGTVRYSSEVEVTAGDAPLTLGRPFPNPAPAGATVRFTLPRATRVRLVAYDALGRAVATLAEGAYEAGSHTVRVGEGLAAGLYVLRLELAGATRTQPLTIVR